MSDVQAIVYKRLLCRICIEKGSYMDQHNTPSSMLQEIRGATNSPRSTLQHREIRDGSAESELISACLTPSFPQLHTNIAPQSTSVKEVLAPILALSPLPPKEPTKKGGAHSLPPSQV